MAHQKLIVIEENITKQEGDDESSSIPLHALRPAFSSDSSPSDDSDSLNNGPLFFQIGGGDHQQPSISSYASSVASNITPQPASTNPSAQSTSSEFATDSVDLGAGDKASRTLKTPRLPWTPQLHIRFVDAVNYLGIESAVPEVIMQLMGVDELTRENVASHLREYRLDFKRIQGLSSGGAGAGTGNGTGGGGGLAAGADAATDHLSASSPVPPLFLRRVNSDNFLPFVPVAALQHHQHNQQIVDAAAVAHPLLQDQYHRQMDNFGSPPNGQFEHPFLARQTPPQQQAVHRMGAPVHNGVPGYMEDSESANGNGRRKTLDLFPTGDD